MSIQGYVTMCYLNYLGRYISSTVAKSTLRNQIFMNIINKGTKILFTVTVMFTEYH